MNNSRIMLGTFIIAILIVGGLIVRFENRHEESKSITLLESQAERSSPKSFQPPPSTDAVPEGEPDFTSGKDQPGISQERNEKVLPVYPNVISEKKIEPEQLEAKGLSGEVYRYETDDLMEDVVGFFEKELGVEYTYRGPGGRVEFILEKENPSYTFELPNRRHPDEPGTTYDEEFEIIWKSIVVMYESETDSTIIVSQDLDREDVMARWQWNMENKAAQIKQGPQLYVPPEQE